MSQISSQEILFIHLMQIWQLFIVLRHPVTISVPVSSNPTKLTNDLNKRDLQALTLAGPSVTRPVPDPLAVLSVDN